MGLTQARGGRGRAEERAEGRPRGGPRGGPRAGRGAGRGGAGPAKRAEERAPPGSLVETRAPGTGLSRAPTAALRRAPGFSRNLTLALERVAQRSGLHPSARPAWRTGLRGRRLRGDHVGDHRERRGLRASARPGRRPGGPRSARPPNTSAFSPGCGNRLRRLSSRRLVAAPSRALLGQPRPPG